MKAESKEQHSITRKPLKLALFAAFLALVLALASSCMLPSFSTENGNNGNTIRGLYNQPRDSIQVLFLGTSSTLFGVSPVDIYEAEGISSYNLATRAQPLMVSYFLLREAYALNPRSLAVVVMDPVKVIDEPETSARAKQSILLMKPSPLKWQALWEASHYYEDFSLLSNAIPILGYHARWKSLTTDDFEHMALGDASFDFSDHGYGARYGSRQDDETAGAWKSRDVVDESTLENVSGDSLALTRNNDGPYNDSLDYLDRIVSFCKDQGIELIFAKMPRLKWDSESHDALQQLSESYDIPFVDLNSQEAIENMNLDFSLDFVDKLHANVQGAQKISKYIGNALAPLISPAPEDPSVLRINFTQADLDARSREIEDSQLYGCQSLEEYLSLISRERYTVFCASQGSDIAITPAMAYSMREIGMNTLADITSGRFYVGVLHEGHAFRGFSSKLEQEAFYRNYFDGRRLMVGERSMQKGAKLDHYFELQAGTEASILFDNLDYCVKGDGINFVVYDTDTGELIDSSCFSLTAPYERRPAPIPQPVQE